MSATRTLTSTLPKASTLDNTELTKALQFAKDLARESGVIMKRYFQATDIGIEWKEDNSPVTVADRTINDLVIEKIKVTYPEYGVVGEEASYKADRETVWVVDPIDGTAPFSFGMPISTFCLALVHNGDVQVSVVYDPFQDRMYSAQVGLGAYMNDVRLHVSDASTLKKQYILAFRSLTKPNHTGINTMFDAIQREGAKTYMFASFSYAGALVADSRFVAACMEYGSPWDAAAISLIVSESGGMATDLNGKPRKYNIWADGLILSNGKVHQKLVDLIDYENTRD